MKELIPIFAIGATILAFLLTAKKPSHEPHRTVRDPEDSYDRVSEGTYEGVAYKILDVDGTRLRPYAWRSSISRWISTEPLITTLPQTIEAAEESVRKYVDDRIDDGWGVRHSGLWGD